MTISELYHMFYTGVQRFADPGNTVLQYDLLGFAKVMSVYFVLSSICQSVRHQKQ